MFENISKNELRIKYKGIRNALNVATINELSDRIMDRLYETEIFNTSKEILTFINTKSEVNTSKLINHCFEINKKVAVPKVMGDEMKFYYISSFEDVKPGTMNILEPNGNSLPSYHKHFLYKDDKTWCIEGDSFGYLEIKTKKGIQLKLGIGICMDINPYEFKAPFNAFEFAKFCKKKDVDLIIFPTNWNDEPDGKNDTFGVMHMLNYWLERLTPIVEKSKKNKYFLAADRTGKEKTSTFIGCSCAMQLSPNCKIIDNYDKVKEGILKVTLDI